MTWQRAYQQSKHVSLQSDQAEPDAEAAIKVVHYSIAHAPFTHLGAAASEAEPVGHTHMIACVTEEWCTERDESLRIFIRELTAMRG